MIARLAEVRTALACAFILRAAVALASWTIHGNANALITPDGEQYLEGARELAHRARFFRDGSPELMRTPGFPVLLVPGVLAGLPVAWAIVLNAGLGALIAWLAARSCAVLGRPEQAGRAAWLVALEPTQVLHSCFVLADVALAAAVAAACLAIACALRSTRLRDAAIVGVLAGLAAYVKPLGLLLPATSALVLGVLLPASWRRRAAAGALVLACGYGLCLPWVLRNARVAGFPGFTTQVGRAFLLRAGAGAAVVAEGRPYAEVRERELLAVGVGKTGQIRDALEQRALVERGLRQVRRAPGAFLLSQLRGVLVVLFGLGRGTCAVLLGLPEPTLEAGAPLAGGDLAGVVTALRASDSAVLRWALGVWSVGVFYLGLGAAGFALLVRGAETRRYALALLGVALALLLPAGGPLASVRLRVPVMPLVCVCAAFGLARALGVAKRQGIPP